MPKKRVNDIQGLDNITGQHPITPRTTQLIHANPIPKNNPNLSLILPQKYKQSTRIWINCEECYRFYD